MKKSKQKSNKKNTPRFQRHFRKFHSKKTTGHPAYVYDKKNGNYRFIGITTSDNTNGVKNISLDKNPEPNNKEKAYIRPKPMSLPTGTRNDKLKGWKFTDADKKKVQAIIDKDKK